MNDIIRNMIARRSIRKFQPGQIEEEVLGRRHSGA
jgi:hypothetical protein